MLRVLKKNSDRVIPPTLLLLQKIAVFRFGSHLNLHIMYNIYNKVSSCLLLYLYRRKIPMIKNVYEILEEFSNATSHDERKAVLANNPYKHFKEVLDYTFNPKYEFYVTEFPKDYKKPDTLPGIRLAGIESESRRIYLFLKGNETADHLTEEKRHILLLQLLESFEYKEAVVFVNMMKKDLQVPFLNKEIVEEVFGVFV